MSISSLFIVGAGFTRAVFPAAPLNNGLLGQVIGSKNDSTLARVWAGYGSKESDIEMLLTRFDLDLMNKASCFTKEDRDAISGEIAEFVKRFRYKKDVKWLHPFVDETIADSDVIISLNYDCFLEGFLDAHGAWTPNGGYSDDIQNASESLDDSPVDNPRGIRILKIHGSESFRLIPFRDKPESMTVGAVVNDELFPVSGKNKHFGYSNARPYVIAPSFMKQFMVELQFLVVEAIRCAESAKNLIIIGCGLRPEDSHLWLVISSFLKNKEWKKKRIFIVSPHASDTKERIKEVWAHRRIFNTGNLLTAIDSGLESGLSRLNDALRNTPV